MRTVVLEFEGSEQNVSDVLAGLPGFVANMGATFVNATVPENIASPEAQSGVAGEEPKPGFLGDLSEAEKNMEKE